MRTIERRKVRKYIIFSILTPPVEQSTDPSHLHGGMMCENFININDIRGEINRNQIHYDEFVSRGTSILKGKYPAFVSHFVKISNSSSINDTSTTNIAGKFSTSIINIPSQPLTSSTEFGHFQAVGGDRKS
ncbi:hypothetical protein CEXT_55371 [Caerostris extrusa]|uniref:Uncharacterized protein n=1 Tax=Caerostris extrusa TaxID=172846 RepID=A0AAV4VQM6_CAEEX|nr:hypothetical protein CEXT_55371 [Caerostris extrusa]